MSCSQRAAIRGLVRFRHLARDRGAALAAEHGSEIRETFFDAMRRFEEHERSRIGGDRFEPRASLARARRQKAFEAESIGGQSRDRERSGNRRRPRNRAYIAARARSFAHQLISRIGQQRRACIADQRDRSPASSRASSSGTRFDSLCACSDTSGRDTPIAFSSVPGVTRVFSRDHVGACQHFLRARAEIAQISDRSRDDVEPTPRIGHYNSRLT